MNSSVSVSLLLALLCACALRPVLGRFLGLSVGTSRCHVYKTSLQGTCQSIYDCPFVLKTYRQLIPTFCYLQGRDPYVCCPKRSSPTTDVSPPPVSFNCGTSISKPKVRLLEEAIILASPSLRSSFPENADFAHLATAPQLPPFADPLLPFEIPPEVSIVRGVDAFQNSWPWVALLGFGSRSSPTWKCDGVLVNEQWVLTAAHCLINANASVVRLGEHNLLRSGESPHKDFGIIDMVFHPQYYYPKVYHDLALIKLDRPVQINNAIRPICLPWGKKPVPTVGSDVTVIGWGRTSFQGNRSDILQEATIQMIDSQECVNGYSTNNNYGSKFPRGITSDLLCIGDKEGKGRDACQGDSGGPVMYREGGNYILAGVVSEGNGCGNPKFPGIYASVHYAPDLAWIKRIAF